MCQPHFFVTNMTVKQNAIDHMPLAAKVVEQAFCVDICLTGVEFIKEGTELCHPLRELFA